MTKTFIFIGIMLLSCTLLAQEDVPFTRKGKFLIETGGASLFSGIGSSTGGSLFISDGNTLTQLGIEAGKFLTEDLALKVKIGTFSVEGERLTNFGVVGKYYIGGVAPLDLDVGLVSGFGSTSTILGAHLGYAIKAADNIYFEPKAGIIYSEESIAVSVKFAFALMF